MELKRNNVYYCARDDEYCAVTGFTGTDDGDPMVFVVWGDSGIEGVVSPNDLQEAGDEEFTNFWEGHR